MRSVRWLGVLAATAILLGACGQPLKGGAPTGGPTASPTSSARKELAPCAKTEVAPAASADRNLEMVWFKGSSCYLVRDITDILHPATVATFETKDLGIPQFVSATDVSFVDGNQLVRMRWPDSRTVVGDAASAFAWSPDGARAAYISHAIGSANADLHLVSNGQNRVVDSLPASPGGFGCIGSCRYNWDERLLFSADGAYLSFVRNLPDAAFRIWKADGTLVKTFDTGAHPTMSVWSGSTLYFRDDKGVQAWRNGSQSLVLPGVSWIRPRASPGGGKIVYESRDSPGDLAHVNLLDTATGNAQDLATSRSGPAFLNPHLIWYRQERPCTPTDHCVEGPTIPSGKTYIYDLDDKTETESLIAAVFDVWPHTA